MVPATASRGDLTKDGMEMEHKIDPMFAASSCHSADQSPLQGIETAGEVAHEVGEVQQFVSDSLWEKLKDENG